MKGAQGLGAAPGSGWERLTPLVSIFKFYSGIEILWQTALGRGGVRIREGDRALYPPLDVGCTGARAWKREVSREPCNNLFVAGNGVFVDRSKHHGFRNFVSGFIADGCLSAIVVFNVGQTRHSVRVALWSLHRWSFIRIMHRFETGHFHADREYEI